MINNTSTKFAAGGQTHGYNHDHASQMAHSAAARLKIAHGLSGKPEAGPPPTAASGGSYKSQIIDQASRVGAKVGADHVHAAIDRMAQKGSLTPFQAGALKTHNGPLIGAHGAAAQQAIMRELLSKPL